MSAEFLLYRLNFQDRVDLFAKPIPDDRHFAEIARLATEEKFDVVSERRSSGVRWALRSYRSGAVIHEGRSERPFVLLQFARSLLYRRGSVVTPSGVEDAISQSNPPLAAAALLFIDLARHVVAVENTYQIMQTGEVWKHQLEQVLTKATLFSDFTSLVRLQAISPKFAVENRLREIETVTRLRLTLRIPNPDLGPTYRQLFEEMRRGGVRELTEDMRSERGLDFREGTLPRGSLDMGLNGYRKGAIRISGRTGGRLDGFTVDSQVARIVVEGLPEFGAEESLMDGATAVKFIQRILREIDEALGTNEAL